MGCARFSGTLVLPAGGSEVGWKGFALRELKVRGMAGGFSTDRLG